MPAVLDSRQLFQTARLTPSERDARLIDLRRVLAEKFPTTSVPKTGVLATGLEVIDQMEGGLRLGAMTEISGPPAGSSLVLAALLSLLGREKRLGALVDCGSFFNPGSFPPAALKRLLWVRCGLANEAVTAADLLLHDGNLSLLMLDLQGAAWRGVPANTWHRFQRVVEQGNMALAVFTPRPLVEGASVKIAVNWAYNFEAIAGRRAELQAHLEARISARRSLGAPDFAMLRTA